MSSPIRSRFVQVVGGGVFGLTTALQFVKQGWRVRLLDAGPIPHPLAASTDVSKIVRIEYGSDASYMEMAEEARTGWEEWNNLADQDLFVRTGVLMMSQRPMRPGGFEFESYVLLKNRGHQPERLNRADVARRFPAWADCSFVDGFFNAEDGYAKSSEAIRWLKSVAIAEGLEVRESSHVTRIDGGKTPSVRLVQGDVEESDVIIVAAGAWTPHILPGMEGQIKPTGHPAFHFRPKEPLLFRREVFPTFTADMSRTGFFGFPLNSDGLVKIGHHGLGEGGDPSKDRSVSDDLLAKVNRFLSENLPALKDAELVSTRQCYYADTPEEHFLISWHPEMDNVAVVGGGSGHAFKFAPILGTMVYHILDGLSLDGAEKFGWNRGHSRSGSEQSRFRKN